MLTSLLFECDPLDQPAATDPVERSSWCALRIRIGDRFASRIWDKAIQSERTNLYLPAFPVAEWVVQNWWSLLNELCSSETVPMPLAGAPQRKWLKRHCIRSADSSLMLPALCIFHDGESLCAEWQSDPQDSMPNMPGEFTSAGFSRLDSNAAQNSFAQFINAVLDRVTKVDDGRVREMADNWRAIQSADREEREFCTLAGRMGINPYDRKEMTDELACFLEQRLNDAEEPLVRDLTEIAKPDFIAQQWTWLMKAVADVKLGANQTVPPFELPARGPSPPQFGYRLAHKVRTAANVSPNSPVDSVESVAQNIVGKELRIENRNHIPGYGIRAIIGKSQRNGDIVAVGPQPVREDNRRFLIARVFYHALVTIQSSHRLVTNAYSWDQKASRAFAAELLAPQQALADRVLLSGADSSQVESLCRDFQASTVVIEKQLENAGISVAYD